MSEQGLVQITMVLHAENETGKKFFTNASEIPQYPTESGYRRIEQLREHLWWERMCQKRDDTFGLTVTPLTKIAWVTALEILCKHEVDTISVSQLFYPQGDGEQDVKNRAWIQQMVRRAASPALESVGFVGHAHERNALICIATQAWKKLIETINKHGNPENVLFVGHPVLAPAMVAWSGFCWDTERIEKHEFNPCEGLDLWVDPADGTVSRCSLLEHSHVG